MGRKKADDNAPPQASEPTASEPSKKITTTKVDPAILRRAKTVASYLGMDLFKYINKLISEGVDRDFDAMIRAETKSK